MARPLRLELPGAVYHLTARGNARQPVFLDDEDRQAFLATLAEVVERWGWLCHAFCLMTNHYHLLVETPHPTLARGMRGLNGVYTQRFNRRRGRPGHLFQGRYTAVLVEKDSHLLELCRHIVLNPVRARMVARPEDWPWSSYRATVGLDPGPDWLHTAWTLARFGQDEAEARAAYARFIAEGARPVWDDLKGQIWLGTPAWIERMRTDAAAARALPEIPRAQRLPEPPPLAAIAVAHADRRAAMRAAYATGRHTLRAIARHFGVHESTVSRAVRGAAAAPP